jgi:hypothetical protein
MTEKEKILREGLEKIANLPVTLAKVLDLARYTLARADAVADDEFLTSLREALIKSGLDARDEPILGHDGLQVTHGIDDSFFRVSYGNRAVRWEPLPSAPKGNGHE